MRSIEGFYGLTFAERKDIMTATFAPTPAATYAYYTFFTDAGHGWLKVPVAELLELVDRAIELALIFELLDPGIDRVRVLRATRKRNPSHQRRDQCGRGSSAPT